MDCQRLRGLADFLVRFAKLKHLTIESDLDISSRDANPYGETVHDLLNAQAVSMVDLETLHIDIGCSRRVQCD
jgi:hypothetical protein